jgi:hypothetical protein
VGPAKQLAGAAAEPVLHVGLVGRTRRRRGTVIAVECLPPGPRVGAKRKEGRTYGQGDRPAVASCPAIWGKPPGPPRQPPSGPGGDLLGSFLASDRLRPCLVYYPKFFHPTHRIFGHIYGTLNVHKKIN